MAAWPAEQVAEQDSRCDAAASECNMTNSDVTTMLFCKETPDEDERALVCNAEEVTPSELGSSRRDKLVNLR